MLFSTLVSQCYFKNGQNEKGRRYVSEEKKTEEKSKQCYRNDICSWDSFSSNLKL